MMFYSGEDQKALELLLCYMIMVENVLLIEAFS